MAETICKTCGQKVITEDPPVKPEDVHKAAGFELVAEGDDVKAKPGDIVQKGSDGVRRIYRKGA